MKDTPEAEWSRAYPILTYVDGVRTLSVFREDNELNSPVGVLDYYKVRVTGIFHQTGFVDHTRVVDGTFIDQAEHHADYYAVEACGAVTIAPLTPTPTAAE